MSLGRAASSRSPTILAGVRSPEPPLVRQLGGPALAKPILEGWRLGESLAPRATLRLVPFLQLDLLLGLPRRQHASQSVELPSLASPIMGEASSLHSMPRDKVRPAIPMLHSEHLSLLRPVRVGSLPLGDVGLPSRGGRLDWLGRARRRKRAAARRGEVTESLLQRRHAAVSTGRRGLDRDIADPEDGAASLALEAHATLGQ